MNILVTGGSKCGKSSFAEKLALRLASDRFVLYIATMKSVDEEDMSIVRRHRVWRREKPFLVFEQEKNLERLVLPENRVILLEDLPNLIANEMFDGGCADLIVRQLKHVSLQTDNLILVTNEIDADGRTYSDEVRHYMEKTGEINRKCAAWCDIVVECISGCPFILKGAFL